MRKGLLSVLRHWKPALWNPCLEPSAGIDRKHRVNHRKGVSTLTVKSSYSSVQSTMDSETGVILKYKTVKHGATAI